MTSGGTNPEQPHQHAGMSGGYPPPEGQEPGAQTPPGSPPAPDSTHTGEQHPPPEGGYTPYPPPGGYGPAPGAYPPPPPPQYDEYPPHSGGGWVPSTRFSVVDALSYAWQKFAGNAGTWLGATLIMWVFSVALNVIGAATHSTAVEILFRVVDIVAWILYANGMAGAALSEVDGVRPTLMRFTQFTNLGQFVVAAILTIVAIAIGLFLLVIPGIIVAFLLYWTTLFVVDHGQTAVTAMRSSANAVRTRVGGVLALLIVVAVINAIGAALCGLGLLITGPIGIIASAYAYRTTIGGRVAPA